VQEWIILGLAALVRSDDRAVAQEESQEADVFTTGCAVHTTEHAGGRRSAQAPTRRPPPNDV